MLGEKVRILNFDGSLLRQTRLIERYRPAIIDLTALGCSGRLWANKKTAAAIGAALQPQSQHAVTFLGSGDFHHVSELLVSRFAEPLTLIVLDFHPDWDILPPRLGCGSWVSRALELKNISKVLLLGISSEDIASPAIHTGNLQALKDDRLEIYPCAHKPTRVQLRNVPRNSSIQVRRSGLASEITWTELQGRDMEMLMAGVLQRCTSRNAYISIDKDCLSSDHALSNWEEGRFSLEELLRLLKVIQGTMNIVGLDITGEYSEPVVAGRIKALCSRLDHPANYSACAAPVGKIDATNEDTNLQLLEALIGSGSAGD
jgi:hypothetical protein